MIAVDTNILVYAHRKDMELHQRARETVARLAESSAPWAIPWPCIAEFVAVVTNGRVFKKPTPLANAVEQVDAWLASPSATLLSETPQLWSTFRATLLAGRVSGGQVHDARVAALCAAHGVRDLWTADRDFSRMPGLRTRNPLVGGAP